MTKEVNAFNMLHAKMKKQGYRPAFSVLVTDESIYLATCRCSDTTKAPIIGAFVVFKHVSMPIWYTKE